MTLVLFIVSMFIVFLAFQALQHKQEIVAYESVAFRQINAQVEAQHRKLDKDYRRFKNSLDQI